MKQFNLLESPLSGINLIEASAGTGKTYTIECLFLRLILEKGLSVREILAVTYTVAATEELRDRIRRKLREAFNVFSGAETKDPFVAGIRDKTADHHVARRVLKDALHDFDEASIYTIHAFCQRMLNENAFESGVPFETEVIGADKRLRRDILLDFWRRHFYPAPPEFVEFAMAGKCSCESFFDLSGKNLIDPELRIVPAPPEAPAPLATLGPFRDAIADLKKKWPKARAEVEKLFGTKAFSQISYGKRIPGLLKAMDGLCGSENPRPSLFKDFHRFTPEGMNLTKGAVPPPHEFFDICARVRNSGAQLLSEMDQHLLYLRGEALKFAEREISRRKRRRNVLSFDDLLTRLKASLEGRGGSELSARMQSRYRAVLIDEFQDTDPVQVAIFETVFGKGDCLLFYIGDPKQAIYSFRGADLFSYMKAAGRMGSRFSLRENWRSEPALIGAVNTIFTGANPFLYDDIGFEPALPQQSGEHKIFKIDGEAGPPLQLWYVDSRKHSDNENPVLKPRAREVIAESVAAEISRLVQLGRRGRARIGDEPVTERDIAVLVRKNDEARMVQEALSRLKIPGVLYSTGYLFDSDEALEMERVLAAVCEPGRQGLLRAALATALLGHGGESLEGMDEAQWENQFSKFREYYDLWEHYGFIRMFRRLLEQENVRERLIVFPEGERRLTNILHLAEVLHQESRARSLGPVALLRWVARQRDSEESRENEELQLRLESDEDAVKLVTLHKSKGLEYPIVFCPFTWEGSEPRRDETALRVHDEKWRPRIVLDVKMEPFRSLAMKETLGENLRLLYVGLTRARNRCYWVWGRINEADTSAPAYLLHYGDRNDEILKEKLARDSSDDKLLQDLAGLERAAMGSIAVSPLPVGGALSIPEKKETRVLQPKVFSGSIAPHWSVASFSSLITGSRETAPDPVAADDDRDEAVSEPQGLTGILGFPRGPRPGNFFHELLEELDYTDADTFAPLVKEKLGAYGFGAEWEETVCALLRNIVSAPLDPGKRIYLSAIDRDSRINEMPFTYPLRDISPVELKKLFAGFEAAEVSGFPARIGDLQFEPTRGFMKGIIDLVFRSGGRFYIVDWKSSFLGSSAEDYSPGNIRLAMIRDFYLLQAYLYSLALDRYLAAKIAGYSYETHFGGIYYVFLRGIDPSAPGRGIYSGRPSAGLIEAMRDRILDRSK